MRRYSICNRTLKEYTNTAEIEKAIKTLPLPDRISLYKDMPLLIGWQLEDIDWQRLAFDCYFRDNEANHE